MSIRIITDTSSDFDAGRLRELGADLVRMTINAGDHSYADGLDLSRSDFYEMLLSDSVVLKTSQPSPQDFVTLFEEARDNGDDVIAILISGKLSGTVQSAQTARDMVGYSRVHIVDSLCASVGIQFLVLEAHRMIQQGASVQEIIARLEDVRGRVRIYLGIDTLKYLYRGGRLSSVEAGLGTLASVHPILMLKNGALEVHSKCMGKKKTIRRLAEIIRDAPRDRDFPLRFIYSYDDANCRTLMDHFFSASESDMQEIGPTLAVHAGPGVFAGVLVEAQPQI